MLVEPPWKGRTGDDPTEVVITELCCLGGFCLFGFFVFGFFLHNCVFVRISWYTCRRHRRCYQMDQSSQCCQRAIFEVSLTLTEALGQFVVLSWPGEAADARTAKGRAAFQGNSVKLGRGKSCFY